MKKWYQWIYLSLGFALGGIINYFDGRQTIAAVIQVCVTLALAFIQFFCDKNGEKGRLVFRYISIAVIVLLVSWLVYTVISMLK